MMVPGTPLRGLFIAVLLVQIVGLCDGGVNDSYSSEYYYSYDNPWLKGFWFGGTFVELSDEQQVQLLYEQDICLERMIVEPYPTDGGLYCNRTWDSWGCWNDTMAGNTSFITCPYFIPNSDPTRLAHKVCMPDGTWFVHPETNNTWSNYSNCAIDNGQEGALGGLIIWYVGYSVSIVSLTVALVIFSYFKNLSCARITLHKNLFLSFIFNGICWILWFSIVVEHSSIIDSDDEGTQVACKILNVVTQFFWTSNYFWMLCEGIYLHTLVAVAVFSDRNRLIWYYLLGWVVPFVPVTIYTILRAVEGHGECWFTATDYEFIIAGPIIAVLAINFILLLNIVRVLITKLRATHGPVTHNYKRAVRATLILLPLLGLHYIVMPFQPSEIGIVAQIYDLIIAILIAFQGFFVACIFCFFNGEVMDTLYRFIRNFLLSHPLSYSSSSARTSKKKKVPTATLR